MRSDRIHGWPAVFVGGLFATVLLATPVVAQDPGTNLEGYRYLYRISQAQRELAAGRTGRAEQVLSTCRTLDRNWEWYHLTRLCRPEAMRLAGIKGEVFGVAFSPFGRSIAAATYRNVHLYDGKTSKLRFTFTRSGGAEVAFTADGRMLALASFKTVELFDALKGKPLGSIEAHALRAAAVGSRHWHGDAVDRSPRRAGDQRGVQCQRPRHRVGERRRQGQDLALALTGFKPGEARVSRRGDERCATSCTLSAPRIGC